MKSAFPLYKPLGATPLETITAWRVQNNISETVSIGYAGRLDPMAEGVLLVLVGDENKKRKEYERLPKTYDVDILVGITTDTYDTLGIIEQMNNTTIRQGNITSALQDMIGTFEQAYPPYSAVRVQGKPLFYWAREGTLDTIAIPTKKVTIQSIVANEETEITGAAVLSEVLRRTTLVTGEFRQDATRASWTERMQEAQDLVFPMLRVTVTCTSGTYMRSVAHDLGKRLGVGAMAYQIVRTSVGPYTLTQVEALK